MKGDREGVCAVQLSEGMTDDEIADAIDQARRSCPCGACIRARIAHRIEYDRGHVEISTDRRGRCIGFVVP